MAYDCQYRQAGSSRGKDVMQTLQAVRAQARQFLENEKRMHETYAEMQTVAEDVIRTAGEIEDGGSDKFSFAAAQCYAQYVHSATLSDSGKEAALESVEIMLPSQTSGCENMRMTATGVLRLKLVQDPGAAVGGFRSATGRVLWPACEVLCSHLASIGTPEARALEGLTVLELGSGLGALGLYVALACGAAHVFLTDVPDALPLLQRNIVENGLGAACERPSERSREAPSIDKASAISAEQSEPLVEVVGLDWRHEQLPPRVNSVSPFGAVLGADVSYSASFVPDLIKVIRKCSGPDTLIYISAGHRPGEVEYFREACSCGGLHVEAEVRYPSKPSPFFEDPWDTTVFKLRSASDLDLMD